MAATKLPYSLASPAPQKLAYSLSPPPQKLAYSLTVQAPQKLPYSITPAPQKLSYSLAGAIISPPELTTAVACAIGGGATLTAALALNLTGAVPLAVRVFGRSGDAPITVTTTTSATTVTAVVGVDDVYLVQITRASGSVAVYAPVAVTCAGYKCFREQNRADVAPGSITPRWREIRARLAVIAPMAAVGNIDGARAHIDVLTQLCTTPDCGCC